MARLLLGREWGFVPWKGCLVLVLLIHTAHLLLTRGISNVRSPCSPAATIAHIRPFPGRWGINRRNKSQSNSGWCGSFFFSRISPLTCNVGRLASSFCLACQTHSAYLEVALLICIRAARFMSTKFERIFSFRSQCFLSF